MQEHSTAGSSHPSGAMVASVESPASTFNGYIFLLLLLADADEDVGVGSSMTQDGQEGRRAVAEDNDAAF